MAAAPVLDPQAFLQLAGHPLRWALLGELARSDRSVHELVARTGEPQNLVSYHLGKLRDARLVAARRSSADRRAAYYTADLVRLGDLLAATGAAVHPALRLRRTDPTDTAFARPVCVLFLCTGNSARSVMAEALTRARTGGRVEAHSAGSHPKPLHPLAVRAMREVHGIELTGHEPTHLDAYAGERFDRVVTLCDRVREVCPPFPGEPEAVHWSIPDPAAAVSPGGRAGFSYPAFRRAAVEIGTRVGFLLVALAAEPGTAA